MKEILICEKCKSLKGFIGSVPPICSFGNFNNKYWLLSLNPSYQEFFDSKMNEIADPPVFRLDYYGIENRAEITDDIAYKIIKDQNNYFKRNYYKKWFNQKETILNNAKLSFGINGKTAKVSNVDVVKCATYPKWGNLPPNIQKEYCHNCISHLTRQLMSATELEYILINGKTPYETLKAIIDKQKLFNKIDQAIDSEKPQIIKYKGYFKIKNKIIRIFGTNKILRFTTKQWIEHLSSLLQ